MPLYEVAILETPTKKEAEDGAVEKLLLSPRAVVAKNEQSAAIAVAIDAKNDMPAFDKQRMTVLVRPFV